MVFARDFSRSPFYGSVLSTQVCDLTFSCVPIERRKSRPLSQADSNLKKRLSKIMFMGADSNVSPLMEGSDDEVCPKSAVSLIGVLLNSIVCVCT